jgi:putative tryptophan/tyrosine transport system substrate-binding protein
MNNRRKLVIALGAGALAASFGSLAQQKGRVWRVGFLSTSNRPPSLDSGSSGAFLEGMRELGYIEGKNLAIEWRFADGKFERLPDLAAELVQLKVDVIVTASTPAIRAAQKATTTVPIVMASSADAVGTGLVSSLARPGGNTTGMTILVPELSAKRLEVLKEALPKAERVGVLWNSTAGPAGGLALRATEAAASKLALHLQPVDVRGPDEIEAAVSIIAKGHAEALFIIEGPMLIQNRGQVIEIAARNRLPTVAPLREFADAGGLIAYGPSLVDSFRHSARYVDKILRGTKPADLPVEQPSKLELIVNMKTAKALGIKIPQLILVRADKLIE